MRAKINTAFLIYGISLFFCLVMNPCGAQAQQMLLASIQPSLDIRVVHPPKPVVIEGKLTLVFELQIINFYSAPLTIDRIVIADAKDLNRVAEFGEDEIAARFHKPGQKAGDVRSASLAPGCAGVFYIEFSVERLPSNASLHHTVMFRREGQAGEALSSVHGAITSIISDPPLMLGPPLAGGPWVAIHLPSWERGHRRVIYTVDGKARIPGRFAIDFIKVDDNGLFATGDADLIRNWYGYDTDVLAVADGVIASARDDFPESPTVSSHPAHSSDKAAGNYISMKIGNGQYVFYEHLKPQSIRVKPGQKVRKGDVIASLGFTGQTTGPHLHFHVVDADSPLGAEGQPFVFENFTLLGHYPDFSAFGRKRWQESSPAREVRQERPAPNAVARFHGK